MAMPSRVELIAEITGGANAVTDTGSVDVHEFDQIGYQCSSNVAITASTITINGSMAPGGVQPVLAKGGAWTAATVHTSAGIGPGVGAGTNGGVPVPWCVPSFISVNTSAAGVGVIVTIRIYGRRNHRGPDVSAVPD